ncbi:T9SS type A sorting domain-containing protein [Aquimarina spongiae]|uniref:Por secretion system C-terminal sorting domain-containing protein n=1 Tax=Aquimarina spongiae TaxID=570521 RepID=A0A1M6L771_9FLAO|nr:T9SS type A sorting domain-containing protein [Aquimarina spongiae]SHJ66984.1 Por secretion system C-terminal sorting domain-containing protein [Aquimarina spongiae]
MKKQLPLIFFLFSFSISSIIAQNQFFNGDVIAKGSMQIGGDASNGYTFGSDTFVMTENNLRMYFDDTSSGSFPANDWRFTFNDTSNGGDSYFAIDDATGNKRPFRIDAGAPNNAFRIADNGNIGIGTSSPGTIELSILDNDTPTIRLGQNGGFGTQLWDIAGNEANFFIRDVTNGSKLPFKIEPNTPSNTFAIGEDGNVGIGFTGNTFPNINSEASIHLKATDQGLLINRMTTDQRTTFGASLDTDENGMMVYDTEENNLYLWNGTAWVTDTDAQDLELSDNTLSLTNDATTVDLAKYLDNTDNQTIDVFELDGNTLELSLERDGEATQTVDLAKYLDNTDAQELALNTNELSISGGTNTIDLSDYLDNTDAQDLELTTNTLSLTNDATTVDLSKYLDNTDAQDLELSGNTLSLTNDGTAVDLSKYQDNTDEQTLTLTNTKLEISGGNSIDLSVLQDGTGTDNQTLNLSSNVLSISGGNTVDFSGYVNTDNQDLTAANLNGSDLTIEIQDGNSVTVDLAPLMLPLESDLIDAQDEIADLISENQTQQALIEDLISRIEALEQNSGNTQNPTNRSNVPVLYQNIPNPFNGTTTIKYYLPDGITNATIVFSDMLGQVFSKIALTKTGDGELYINSEGLAVGTYFYTMYVGSRKIDTKKMVIQ